MNVFVVWLWVSNIKFKQTKYVLQRTGENVLAVKNIFIIEIIMYCHQFFC